MWEWRIIDGVKLGEGRAIAQAPRRWLLLKDPLGSIS
jgi:hypothetical protein